LPGVHALAMDDRAIVVALWDGVEELDFAGPYEVLAAWARESEREITVRTVAETTAPVRCSHGLQVIPDVAWADVGHVDVLVLPGGDSRPLVADEGFRQRMRDLAEAGTLMTSVCTGALVYGAAGLLADRPATTHWGALDRLAAYGAKVDAEARFVDDGDIVTAAGVSAGIDMALHLVARLESPERAWSVRRYIQYDPQPPV
jgi:transcriptional regulator GlxA family with amidase domain